MDADRKDYLLYPAITAAINLALTHFLIGGVALLNPFGGML